MQEIKPILNEQWVIDGISSMERMDDQDALYICPILNTNLFIEDEIDVIHSLILDNNILSDIVENRRPLNTEYLNVLLRNRQLEINPIYAMTEQRQKYFGATEAINKYAEYLHEKFGWNAAAHGAAEFDESLENRKIEFSNNITMLSGYIPAIIYLYQNDATAAQKLEWLSGIIVNADVPLLELQFYLAALLFISKEYPNKFHACYTKKINKEMKIAGSIEDQERKVRNLSNDIALIAFSIFQPINPRTLVLPYIATRDFLVELILSQISCAAIHPYSDGRAAGSWFIRPGSHLDTLLGSEISKNLPRRNAPSSPDNLRARTSRLKALSDQYIRLCVDIKDSGA